MPIVSNEKYAELIKAKVEQKYRDVIKEEMDKKTIEIWSTSRIEAMDRAIVEAIAVAVLELMSQSSQ